MIHLDYRHREQSEALLNDKHRQMLFEELFNTYSKAMPLIAIDSNGNIRTAYSAATEKYAEAVRVQITLRDQEIFNSFENK